MDTSPQLPKKSFTSNNLPSTGSSDTPAHVRTTKDFSQDNLNKADLCGELIQ